MWGRRRPGSLLGYRNVASAERYSDRRAGRMLRQGHIQQLVTFGPTLIRRNAAKRRCLAPKNPEGRTLARGDRPATQPCRHVEDCHANASGKRSRVHSGLHSARSPDTPVRTFSRPRDARREIACDLPDDGTASSATDGACGPVGATHSERSIGPVGAASRRLRHPSETVSRSRSRSPVCPPSPVLRTMFAHRAEPG